MNLRNPITQSSLKMANRCTTLTKLFLIKLSSCLNPFKIKNGKIWLRHYTIHMKITSPNILHQMYSKFQMFHGTPFPMLSFLNLLMYLMIPVSLLVDH